MLIVLQTSVNIACALHIKDAACVQKQAAMVASKRRLRTLKRQKNSRDDGHVSVITRVTGNLASAIDTTNSHIKSPHVFETDALDHAETERRAYCHVAPVLKLLAEKLALKPKDLKIWDPYFCKGTVVRYLAEVGFYKVRNLNEDFYKVQQVGLPESGLVQSFQVETDLNEFPLMCGSIFVLIFHKVQVIAHSPMLEVLEFDFGFQFFMHPRTMKFYLRILHTHLITWNGALNFA